MLLTVRYIHIRAEILQVYPMSDTEIESKDFMQRKERLMGLYREEHEHQIMNKNDFMTYHDKYIQKKKDIELNETDCARLEAKLLRIPKEYQEASRVYNMDINNIDKRNDYADARIHMEHLDGVIIDSNIAQKRLYKNKEMQSTFRYIAWAKMTSAAKSQQKCDEYHAEALKIQQEHEEWEKNKRSRTLMRNWLTITPRGVGKHADDVK